MNINSLVRQTQIALITGDTNRVTEWFNDFWSDILVIETNVFHQNGGEFIYYKPIDNTMTCLFFYDSNGAFYCDYVYYWSLLEYIYDLDYDNIQVLTKILLDNVLNSNIPLPIHISPSNFASDIISQVLSKF